MSTNKIDEADTMQMLGFCRSRPGLYGKRDWGKATRAEMKAALEENFSTNPVNQREFEKRYCRRPSAGSIAASQAPHSNDVPVAAAPVAVAPAPISQIQTGQPEDKSEVADPKRHGRAEATLERHRLAAAPYRAPEDSRAGRALARAYPDREPGA